MAVDTNLSPKVYEVNPELFKEEDGAYKVIYIGDKKLNMYVRNNVLYIIDPDYVKSLTDGNNTENVGSAPVPYDPKYIMPMTRDQLDLFEPLIDYRHSNSFRERIDYFDQGDDWRIEFNDHQNALAGPN